MACKYSFRQKCLSISEDFVPLQCQTNQRKIDMDMKDHLLVSTEATHRNGSLRKQTLLLLLVGLLSLASSCSNEDNAIDEPVLKGIVSSYNKYDGAMLDLTKKDLANAGITLGDIVSITIDGKTFDVPYYDGYYTRVGEYLLVAYPSYHSLCFTASNTGLPTELRGLEGRDVTVRLKEKGGCYLVQMAMSMKYSNDRSYYADITDAEFANARAVTAGNIASGVLHRSSTPFTNITNRAFYASDYLKSQKVATVLNLADTEKNMQGYDMPAYSRTLWEGGNVILCPLKADPTADDYNNRLIKALKELPSHPAPYLVHCLEGKDRTGYVCALLEGLCGATYEEIVFDYLLTYDNYYKVNLGNKPEVCSILVMLKLNPCLMFYAGVNDEAQLPDVDYAKAFSNYLLSHGMSQQQIDALVRALTTDSLWDR